MPEPDGRVNFFLAVACLPRRSRLVGVTATNSTWTDYFRNLAGSSVVGIAAAECRIADIAAVAAVAVDAVDTVHVPADIGPVFAPGIAEA